MHGSSRSRRGSSSLALLGVLIPILLSVPTRAAAAVFPLGLLIQDGVVFTPYSRPDGLSVLVSANRPVFTITNGQKSASAIGTAVIYVWQKSVPAPLAASFGAFAGLGVVHLNAPFDFTIHLGLVQAPSGALHTTIGLSHNAEVGGGVDPTVRGSWLIGNGSQVAGGDGNDLVVAGFWVSNTPQSLGPAETFGLLQLFGAPGDSSPMFRQVVGSCDISFCLALGVFHGTSQVRSFAISTTVGDPSRHAHMLVAHLGGNDYGVVACSNAAASFAVVSLPLAGPYTRCTLSGTGTVADISGSVDYSDGGINNSLIATRFRVLP